MFEWHMDMVLVQMKELKPLLDALNCPLLWVSLGLNQGDADAGQWRSLQAAAHRILLSTQLIVDVTSVTAPGCPAAGPSASRPGL